MIGMVRGRLLEKGLQQALIDVGGVAYELELPLTTAAALGQPGEEVALHTHLVVRDDAQALFGFASKEAREAFRALIKVSSVGPKLATAILSVLDAPALAAAVAAGDLGALTQVPGIGRRMAERIAMEMKGRLEALAAAPAAKGGRQGMVADAEAALVSLGYRPQEAARALAQVADDAADVEALIKLALGQLTRQGGRAAS